MSPTLRRIRACFLAIVMALVPAWVPGLYGCAPSYRPVTASPWGQWLGMDLPVKIAKSRVSKEQGRHFERFATEVQAGRYAPGLTALSLAQKDPKGRDWALVLQGHLAGLHTRACHEGQWLRFTPYHPKDTTQLSMIKLLDALAPLASNKDEVLARQAQIAQIRVMVIARDCPGSRIVQHRAQERLPVLLGTLADAQGATLPPDLAYLWATLQLEQRQWSQARHWTSLARKQGFDDPRTTLTLAQSWYGQQDFARAQELAVKGANAIPESMASLKAHAWTLAARAALGLNDIPLARRHLQRAYQAKADHPDALALEVRLYAKTPLDCHETLAAKLAPLWPGASTDLSSLSWTLDEMLMQLDQDGPEALQCMAEALTWNIDGEAKPLLRAIRYYYAATIDARLGNQESALGRALLARGELESAGSPKHPFPVQALIDALKDPNGDAL